MSAGWGQPQGGLPDLPDESGQDDRAALGIALSTTRPMNSQPSQATALPRAHAFAASGLHK